MNKPNSIIMKVEFHHIKLATSYGHYVVIGEVDGNRIEATTTDSMLFDSYNQKDDPYYTELEVEEMCITILEKEVDE